MCNGPRVVTLARESKSKSKKMLVHSKESSIYQREQALQKKKAVSEFFQAIYLRARASVVGLKNTPGVLLVDGTVCTVSNKAHCSFDSAAPPGHSFCTRDAGTF